jgi:NADPH2:quinone reductase
MSLPTTMRFVDHGAGGKPDVLRIAEGPVPAAGAGEIVVRVAWAGVNRPDCAQRAGSYPPPPGASKILGLEVSGEVVAVGPDTPRWKVGDKVCALCNGGGYAEYVAVPGTQALPIPDGLSLRDAAGIPENYFTVWTNVFDRGRLAKGERFLVHGGSSGIGLTAIRMAKAFGATVFTTVGNAEKAEFCAEAGADHVIEYKSQDFVEEVARLTNGEGVDLILDMVGGDYIPRNIKSLAIEGRLVQIAFLSGPKVADFNMTPIMVRRLTVTGSTLRPRSTADKAAIAESLEKHIWPRIAAGEVRPTIHKVFPMDEARAAHELMESSQHIGKILLEVAGEPS